MTLTRPSSPYCSPVVLMDLSMPLVSGFESVEIIRAHERAQQAVDPTFPRTPIFALTVSLSPSESFSSPLLMSFHPLPPTVSRDRQASKCKRERSTTASTHSSANRSR